MPPDYRQQVLAEASRRGLVSFMNDTKWRELRDAVRAELPFGPPFQMKLVLQAEPYPAGFESDVEYWGDWTDESLFPFYAIEWMRIRPRFRRLQGRYGAPEMISVEAEFLAILRRFQIPFRHDEESIWIFGYAGSADGPLASDS